MINAGGGSVGELAVTGLVAGHHLITRDAVGDCMGDPPLLGYRFESSPRLLLSQLYHRRPDDVHAELLLRLQFVDPDSALEDLFRLAHTRERRATQREVHRRLPVAIRPLPATAKVVWRHGSRDLEDPDALVGCPQLIPVAPADVVERIFL